jgi:hypothetical protein
MKAEVNKFSASKVSCSAGDTKNKFSASKVTVKGGDVVNSYSFSKKK